MGGIPDAAEEAALLLDDWEVSGAESGVVVMRYTGPKEAVLPIGRLADAMGRAGYRPGRVVAPKGLVEFTRR